MSLKSLSIDPALKTNLFKFFLLGLGLILVVGISHGRILDSYENVLLDFRFRLRPPQESSDKIIIIEIADDTLNQLGYWPLPRDFHASLIEVLLALGVRQIMFDVLFVEPTQEDGDLYASLKKSGNVYLPYVLRIDDERVSNKIPSANSIVAPLLPQFASVAKGTGHINSYKDIDGKVRWAPLFVEHNKKLYPHIALQMICDYFGVAFEAVRHHRDFISLGEDLRISTSPNGSVLVNYVGPWMKSFRHYSYVEVLTSFHAKMEGKAPRIFLEDFKDAVCFVGLTATGTSDLHAIPLENNYPMVGLHANIFNSFLLRRFLFRVHPLLNDLLLLILIACVYKITLAQKTRPLRGLGYTLGMIVVFFLVGYFLFVFQGMWIDLFYPMVMMLVVYSGTGVYNFWEANKKRELIEKELSIAKQIQESFLPTPLERFHSLDIASHMMTAKHVGGDLYDIQTLGKYKIGIFIGDVSGKGVGAALVMAKTISLFRIFAGNSDEPSDILFQLNEAMAEDMKPGVFVTATYLVYSVLEKRALIASAGHSPTLWLQKNSGSIQKIEPKEGMPLGLMTQVEFTQEEIILKEGDKIVLYTDGVVEAKNLKREEFGEERLYAVLKSTSNEGVRETIVHIERQLQIFAGKAPQHDDCTMIVLKENKSP